MDPQRNTHIVNDWVARLGINLRGVRVLTEAATGNFSFGPGLLLRAGAEHVYCWAKDSIYGTAAEATEQVQAALAALGLPSDCVTFALNERPAAHVKDADLVLNCGPVRPISAEMLSLRKTRRTVVGLMFDQWELRPDDVDIEACRTYGIGLAGVDESHESLRIFPACGALAIKMAHEAGYEIFGNTITVWSDDAFGKVISSAFTSAGAAEVRMTGKDEELARMAKGSDFVFCAKYNEERSLIGSGGLISQLMHTERTNFGLVHLYGAVDTQWARENNIKVAPDKSGHAKRMSRTLDHLGPLYSIGLFAAGAMSAYSAFRDTECAYLQTILPCVSKRAAI
jgi:hypothetical protein